MNNTQEEKLEWLRPEIQKGKDDLEAGRFRDGPTAMAEIRQKLLDLKDRREATSDSENEQTV